MWEELPTRIADGAVYTHADGYYFVWSPIAAVVLAWIIVPLGYPIWLAAHVAVLPLLHSRLLVILMLASVPFWVDAVVGNVMTFVVVAGAAAIRGSRHAAIITLVLFALMPRPLQLPLVGWLLWRDRTLWFPFAVILCITVASVALSGWHWLGVVSGMTRAIDAGANLSPSALVGMSWLVVGIPLAAWLTAKERLGLAGLALSPYLFPQYLMALVWEWPCCPPSGNLAIGRDNYGHFANLPPSRVLGGWWLLLGLPLAALLTSHGRSGLAGQAMSLYVLPV